jgi:hypothetical protein
MKIQNPTSSTWNLFIASCNITQFYIMSSQLLPSKFSLEYTVGVSSLISQVFDILNYSLDEVSETCFPPIPNSLELVSVKGSKKVIRYSLTKKKIAVFETWWDQTPFSQQRQNAHKQGMKWGPQHCIFRLCRPTKWHCGRKTEHSNKMFDREWTETKENRVTLYDDASAAG